MNMNKNNRKKKKKEKVSKLWKKPKTVFHPVRSRIDPLFHSTRANPTARCKSTSYSVGRVRSLFIGNRVPQFYVVEYRGINLPVWPTEPPLSLSLSLYSPVRPSLSRRVNSVAAKHLPCFKPQYDTIRVFDSSDSGGRRRKERLDYLCDPKFELFIRADFNRLDLEGISFRLL